MKKIKTLATAICAVVLFAVYCTDPDFNNPLDPKNSGGDAPSGGRDSRLVLPSGYAWVDDFPEGQRDGLIFRADGVVDFIDDNSGEWRVLFTGMWSTTGNTTLRITAFGESFTDAYTVTGNTLNIDGSRYTRTAITMDGGNNLITFYCPQNSCAEQTGLGVPGGCYTSIDVCRDNIGQVDITYYCPQNSCVEERGESAPSSCYKLESECLIQITIPNAPATVSATPASSSVITVNWGAVAGAAGYYVYRSETSNGTYAQVGESATTSYTDTGLAANTTYYYRVAAHNGAGTGTRSGAASATTLQESGGSYTYYCPTACAEQTGESVPGGCYTEQSECRDAPLPDAPTDVAATAQSQSRIRIDWAKVTDATSYTVYRTLEPDDPTWYREVGTSTTTTFTDNNLTAGRTYYYFVKAHNRVGASEYSSVAEATTMPPAGSGPHYLYCCWLSEENPNGACYPMGPGEVIFGPDVMSGETQCRNNYGIPSETDQTGSMSAEWCRWPAGCFALPQNNTTERNNCLQNSPARRVFSTWAECNNWVSDVEYVPCFWGYMYWANDGASCWAGSFTREQCLAENGNVVNSCAPLCNMCGGAYTPCPLQTENGCNMTTGPIVPPEGMTVIER